MIMRNATASMAMPRASPGSGSPKTMMPPAMQEMFAAVPVMPMTRTASPSCRPRADVGSRQRERQRDQASGGEAEPGPLTRSDVEPEEAIRHDGDQDDAAGEHDLDDRHGSQRQRGDVEAPSARGDEHAQGEPLRGV